MFRAEQQAGQQIALIFPARREDGGIVRRAFDPIVPGIILVGSVAVVFAVGGVALLRIGNDIAQREAVMRRDEIDAARRARRAPETAAAIRQSLEKQYGNESATLYRMLWGYTDKDLEDGEDARLVKFLDHESLIFRVLAFENLRDITRKTLSYNPIPHCGQATPVRATVAAAAAIGQDPFQRAGSEAGGCRRAPPPKEAVPEPPKPLDGDPPADMKPTSATGPLRPDNAAPTKPGAVNRVPPGLLPVSVPEPNPPEKPPASGISGTVTGVDAQPLGGV